MIAGMYLGEIVRLVLLDLCRAGIVFGEEAIEVLEREGNSGTHFATHLTNIVINRLVPDANGLANSRESAASLLGHSKHSRLW